MIDRILCFLVAHLGKVALLAGLAVTACTLSGCQLLDQPVYRLPAPTPENPNPEPVLVFDEDGTTRTVGEDLADQIEQGGATVGTTAGGLLGGPFGPIVALLGAAGGLTAAGSLRSRHKGTKPKATTEPSDT